MKQWGNGAMDRTYYLNDGLTGLNELDSLGNITKSIVAGLSGSIAEVDKNGILTYVHTDILGSAVLLTDPSGAVVGTYEYEPLGDLVGLLETGEGTDYLFTGQEYDVESSLYYYNARYYNPRIGRFISRDAFMGRDGDVLSKNRYIYVKNNPLKYVDPSGEEEEELWKENFGDFLRSLFGIETANAASFGPIRGTGRGMWTTLRNRAYKMFDFKIINPALKNTQFNIIVPQPTVNIDAKPAPAQAQELTKTWDTITDKRIPTLDERLRGPALQFVNKVEADLQIKLRMTAAYRSIEEQNKLYEIGRTKEVDRKPVTQVGGGDSYHNYGFAFDVAPIENGKLNYSTDKWEQIGIIGEGFGFEWGGRWKDFPDKPHFQMTFGSSTSELYKEYQKNIR